MFICERCGDEYTIKYRETQRFCSETCRKQAWYLKSVGRTEYLERTSQDRWIAGGGYVMIKMDGKLKYEHIHIAEQALGKPLPSSAIVHHLNCKSWDNTPTNLVICPNQAYHALIHKRGRDRGYANY